MSPSINTDHKPLIISFLLALSFTIILLLTLFLTKKTSSQNTSLKNLIQTPTKATTPTHTVTPALTASKITPEKLSPIPTQITKENNYLENIDINKHVPVLSNIKWVVQKMDENNPNFPFDNSGSLHPNSNPLTGRLYSYTGSQCDKDVELEGYYSGLHDNGWSNFTAAGGPKGDMMGFERINSDSRDAIIYDYLWSNATYYGDQDADKKPCIIKLNVFIGSQKLEN